MENSNTRELIFLTVGPYSRREDFLQHISEMINVKLEKGDTYNTLFEKLKSLFTDESKIKAVGDWIDFNKEGQTDESVFNKVICEHGETFAVFNLKKVK